MTYMTNRADDAPVITGSVLKERGATILRIVAAYNAERPLR